MDTTKTDKDVLVEMFDRNKIAYEEKDGDITIEAGYAGFVSFFSFDDAGNLKSVEAYE